MTNYDFMVKMTINGADVDLLMYYGAESEEVARQLLKTGLQVDKELSNGRIEGFEILD